MGMMKKLVMAFLCGLMLLCSTAFASDFVPMGKQIVMESVKQNVENNPTVLDFTEGKRKVRFEVGRSNGYDYMMCVQPGRGLFGKDTVVWYSKDKVYQYNAYTVQQFKDTMTDRYYYGIVCWFAMDATYKAYLIGYDPEGKKMVQYINSVTMVPGDNRNVFFDVIRNKLYLRYHQFRFQPDYYQLDWNPSANWFGYAQVDPPQR